MSAIDRNGAERGALAAPALGRVLASPWLAAVLVVVAVLQQLAGHIDCDVSWFITFAEKFVDGRVPYVEVTDPNPPAAFLSLVPAVLLARALHLETEAAVVALVLVFAALSLGLAFGLLRHGAPRSRRAWGMLLNGALFLTLVVPEIVFAEREHIALLAILPLLAALAVDERRAELPRSGRLLAGVMAGAAFAFKPYFALGVGLPALAIAWRERSWRPLWRAELVVAAVAFLAYVAAILVFFPAYFGQALPLVADVYAPARDAWGRLLLHTLAPVYVGLLAGYLLAARGLVPGRASFVALLASLGFFIVFLVQGKGWVNHAFPAIVLLLLAFLLLALGDRAARRGPASGATDALVKFLFVPALVAAPALFGVVEQISDREEHPGLMAAVARAGPPHPRVIAMASQLDLGHPLTRRLGGEWVGRQNALWVTALVGALAPGADPARRERLEAYRRADLEAFAQDMREGRPDIVIVENAPTREFLAARPETAQALAGYSLAERAGEIEVWRRDGASGL